MMFQERFKNLLEDSISFSFRGWHCIFCGAILDPVILENRTKPLVGVEKEETVKK
jgi:hypothetical protein